MHLSRDLARIAVLLVAGALVLPFLVGIMRVARRLGVTLAAIAFPPGDSGGVDLAAAPRRALEVTMQVAGVLVIGAPILAVTQPFLRGIETAAPLIVLAALLGIAFWRSATNLQGHVRAGVQVIVEALEKRLPDENASRDGHARGRRLTSIACCPGWARRCRCVWTKAARRWDARSPS